jgi:hypothetical protein
MDEQRVAIRIKRSRSASGVHHGEHLSPAADYLDPAGRDRPAAIQDAQHRRGDGVRVWQETGQDSIEHAFCIVAGSWLESK